MRLRLATPEDLPALCVLGRLMRDETTFAGMDFDNDRFKEAVQELIDKNQLVQVAEDKNGEVVGAMLCQVKPTWFGNDLIATELGLFIHPDHRGGALAARFIKTFVKWARLAGAKQIRPGVITGCDVAVKLYERLGFRRCGATFLMEGV